MFITWFDEHDPSEAFHLGGKNASLVTMTAAGMPVPPGFAVTADAYRRVIEETGLGEQLHALVDGLDVDNSLALASAGARARELVSGVDMPEWLATEIAAAYVRLSERCSVTDVGVAIRSSATAEDQPDASFAGEHDTYLWVSGLDAVLTKIRHCWASLFTDRAIAYRQQMGYAHHAVAMSVGVQKMVAPRSAGVAFTLNPSNGDRSCVAIDASWGLGEAVVSGSVTPDNFLVDKVLFSVTSRTVSHKHIEHVLGDGRQVEELPVDDERADSPSLTDEEIIAVARLARRAEKYYGCPQDIEWAIDSQLPAGENVLLLQSRPETVWSRKSAVPVVDEATKDTYRSIVSTLLRQTTSTASGGSHGHGHG